MLYSKQARNKHGTGTAQKTQYSRIEKNYIGDGNMKQTTQQETGTQAKEENRQTFGTIAFLEKAEKRADATIKRVENTLYNSVVFNMKAETNTPDGKAVLYINKAEYKTPIVSQELLKVADISTAQIEEHAKTLESRKGFLIQQATANLLRKTAKVMLLKDKTSQ